MGNYMNGCPCLDLDSISFQILVQCSCLERSPPPKTPVRLLNANEEGGDQDRTHGQDLLVCSKSVIMWSSLRETEIEIQRDRKTEKKERTEMS